MINAAPNFRDRCILKTFAQTAIRRFELGNLDIRDLDFERKRLYIREGKGGKARTIPVSEELLGDLRHHIGSRKTGPVFESNKDGNLTARQIDNVVAQVGHWAGVGAPNPQIQEHHLPSVQAQLCPGVEKARWEHREFVQDTRPHISQDHPG